MRPCPHEQKAWNFYSRPCGRGDSKFYRFFLCSFISTHAPAGGATLRRFRQRHPVGISTHAPAGGATHGLYFPKHGIIISTHAPAGGATEAGEKEGREVPLFLLTPLREGRRFTGSGISCFAVISTHAPAGGATFTGFAISQPSRIFLLTPLREGRLIRTSSFHFLRTISTHAPAGGATHVVCAENGSYFISTHAPAGGATAIFHKSVMRFCGKLPKDDTVLCLASFGFPRRDPKAVYLAWISCANLPQKCVRQGLALKDQGTSCFHVGLASHAFDPVLV